MFKRYLIRLAAAAAVSAGMTAWLLWREDSLHPLLFLEGTVLLLSILYGMGWIGEFFTRGLSQMMQFTMMGILFKSLPGFLVGMALIFVLAAAAVAIAVPAGVIQIICKGVQARALDRAELPGCEE